MSELAYMRIEDVDGEEPIGGDQKLIRISGFKHGLALQISPSRPSVGELAKLRRSYCQHALFTVFKGLDKTSGKIFELCSKGIVIGHVAIFLCGSEPSSNPLKKGEFGPEPFLTILMKDVLLASFTYELKGTWPVEQLDFRYSTISFNNSWVSPEDGSAANLPAVGWDGLLDKAAGISDVPTAVKFQP